ncbi:MAG: glycosyltransferase family 2 protein [Candidatus Kuenenia sp.]|nr:glycosyltransferase family 2 protein [Candidatus Kuenenia hertensis]
MNDVCIVIVNWNTRELLLKCIASVYESDTNCSVKICVVDNGSKDDSVAAVRNRYSGVHMIENTGNNGFAAAVNQALNAISSKYYVLLNTDAILEKNTLQKLYTFMESHNNAAIAGVQLLKPNGIKQHSFDNYPTLATELLNKSFLRWLFPDKYLSKKCTITQPIEVESVIGACIIVRNEAIERVGKLDEDYFFFIEETDWCYRMKNAGWSVYHVPDARVNHLGGESKKKAPWQSQIEYCRSLYLFFKKNSSRNTYVTFRIFYVIKIFFNLIINSVGNIIVMFLNRKLRYRLAIYYRLFLWHVLFCPDSMGLRSAKPGKR